jgi:hypothetical protein
MESFMTDLTKFNLATANSQELRSYAGNLTPPLELHQATGEAKMRDKILIHCENNELETPPSSLASVPSSNKKGDWYTITIAKQAGKGGGEPAGVGVQGVWNTIPRGIPIAVPASIVGALDTAVQQIVTQDPDSGELETDDVMTYPYQIIKGPHPRPGQAA